MTKDYKECPHANCSSLSSTSRVGYIACHTCGVLFENKTWKIVGKVSQNPNYTTNEYWHDDGKKEIVR